MFKLAAMVIVSLVSFSASSAVVVNGSINGSNAGVNSVHVGESVTGDYLTGGNGVSVSVSNPQVSGGVKNSICENAFMRRFSSYCKK